MLFNNLQLIKAASSMVFRLAGAVKVTAVKLVQPPKAYLPMAVTVAGRVISVMVF